MGCSVSQPKDPSSQFIRRIIVRPWGVVGAPSSKGKEARLGGEPDKDTLLLACSTLDELRNPGCRLGQLPAPLADICHLLGTADDSMFPDDVLANIREEGQAAYHRYGYPSSYHVIHAVHLNLAPRSSEIELRYGLSVRSMHRIPSTGTLLCLSMGSVVDFTGDAVVNAANEGTIQGAGVDDAINVAGGKALRDARFALPIVSGAARRDGAPGDVRCPMGEVRVTVGGSLKASWCIHAVGPNYNVETKHGVSMEKCDELVRSIYMKVIEAAKEKQLTSIAFCLISCGMFRGKQSLLNVLVKGLEGIRDSAYEGLKEVHVVGYTKDEQASLDEACKLVLPDSREVPNSRDDEKMAESAAIEKLTGAYSNVLSVATQFDKSLLRLSPISDGSSAGELRQLMPRISMIALAKAVRQMPTMIVEKLPKLVEMCVEDQALARKYEEALNEAQLVA